MKKSQFLPFAIIQCAMHMAVILFVVVLFIMSANGGWNEGFVITQKMHLIMMGGMSVSMAIVTVLMPVIFKGQLGIPQSMTSLFLDYSDNNISKVQTVTIIRLALAESIGIFGFISAVINHSVLIVLPFAVLALILQFLFGPIYGRMRSAKSISKNYYEQ